MKQYILLTTTLFLAACVNSPYSIKQMPIHELRTVSDANLCNAYNFNGYWSGFNVPTFRYEMRRRNLDCITGMRSAPVSARVAPPIRSRATPTKRVPPPQSATGSGFFASRFGHVVTNAHVVDRCKRISIGDNSNSQTEAKIVASDKINDLALLKISTLGLASSETKSLIKRLGINVVPLAASGLLRSEDVELGESVLVAGFPFGDVFSNTIKVTGGMVSAIRGTGDNSSQFQMDAAVQSGNSGGPIYDEFGNVVGVVVAQLNKLKVAKIIGSLPENVNFGIKASTVRQFLNSNGLPSKWSRRTKTMSTKQLAKIAQKQTLMIICKRLSAVSGNGDFDIFYLHIPHLMEL